MAGPEQDELNEEGRFYDNSLPLETSVFSLTRKNAINTTKISCF